MASRATSGTTKSGVGIATQLNSHRNTRDLLDLPPGLLLLTEHCLCGAVRIPLENGLSRTASAPRERNQFYRDQDHTPDRYPLHLSTDLTIPPSLIT